MMRLLLRCSLLATLVLSCGDDEPADSDRALTCAYLHGANCLKDAFAEVEACVPGLTATRAATSAVCTFAADSSVTAVLDEIPHPRGFTIASGAGACATVFVGAAGPDDPDFEEGTFVKKLTTASGTASMNDNRPDGKVVVACPDGTKRSGSFDSLIQECPSDFHDIGWSSTLDSATFEMPLGSPLFTCSVE